MHWSKSYAETHLESGVWTFGCGMTYVSLSRVTKINGLHPIDFDRTKIGKMAKFLSRSFPSDPAARPVNYEVQRSLQSRPWIVHVDKLKACHSSEEAWLSGDAATATSKQSDPVAADHTVSVRTRRTMRIPAGFRD